MIIEGATPDTGHEYEIEAQQIYIREDGSTAFVKFNDEMPYLTFLAPHKAIMAIKLQD